MSDRDAHLARYIATYWGHGNLDAPHWFVGMEEGGGGRWEEVLAHLDRRERLGGSQVAPFRPPNEDLTDHRWFGSRPRIRPALLGQTHPSRARR